MCLAILKPAKISIPSDNLKEGWISNPDGAGFAFVRKGKVVLSKGYMTLKEFLEGYSTATKSNPNSPFLIHFRIRTQGDKSQENTHPFPINGGALIHNGSISGTGAVYNTGPSDTNLFAKKYGEYLTYERVIKYRKQWEEAVGYNKIAMLYDDGRHAIINESAGYWIDDVWYSNHSFQRVQSSAYSGNNPYGYMGGNGGYAEYHERLLN